MSNKSLTVLILVLLILCGVTFGAFYLKINPELALSQKIFGAKSGEAEMNNEEGDNSPFGQLSNSTTDNNADSVENTVPGTNNDTTAGIQNPDGVTLTPSGDANATVIPNDTKVDVPKTNTSTSTNTSEKNPCENMTCWFVNKDVKKGSKGEDVKNLQLFLIHNEYLTGKADGVFGAMTEAAVKKFQTEYKLTVDGIVAGKTRTTINEIISTE